MSEELRIILPKAIADMIKKECEKRKITIEQLFMRAIVKILEEESK